ncbi:Vacuolar protein sorting-associated protein 55 [Balamuthia mandrillaris]
MHNCPTNRLVFSALTLALGLTMNLVACILWKNWYPIIVAVVFLLAPLPNIIFHACTEPDTMAFIEGPQKNWQDMGYFLTGFLLVFGIGLPLIFIHATIIEVLPMVLCLIGGLVTYSSIETYVQFFHRRREEADVF